MSSSNPINRIGAKPDTHCYDEDAKDDVWSYSPALVARLLLQETERCANLAEAEECDFIARMIRGTAA